MVLSIPMSKYRRIDMNQQTFKYDVFISYKHEPTDKKVAQYLQKALEQYKIPKQRKVNFEGAFCDFFFPFSCIAPPVHPHRKHIYF